MFDVIVRLAQAQGIVSAQAGCGLDEALQTMRERALIEHRTVNQIADAELARTISFGAGLTVSDEAAAIRQLIDKDQIIDLVHEYSYRVDHRGTTKSSNSSPKTA